MKLNITKNFIIAFFVILAIYQTSGLWFGDSSNHNFFYSFFNNSKSADDDGLLYSLDNIIVNQGSDKLICLKNNIYQNEYKSSFDSAVKATMENGSVLARTEFDWNNILSGRSIIYQYSCEIDSKSISNMFGFNESLLSSFSDKMDTVVVVPYATTPETLVVGFGNRKTGKGCFYSLEKNQIIYDVYNNIGSVTASDAEVYYTSSIKNGIDIFGSNVFIPQWNNKTKYYTIKAEGQFYENNEFEPLKLEKCVDVFFDNAASKWASISNGIYVYSDENTVVKYYPNDIIEYYNYSTEKAGSEESFYSQYKSAVSFLKKDSNIKNEYYLSGYYSDSEKIVFYFDYKLNNFSVELSDELKNDLGLNSIIEVTVSGGKVSKYRRYAKEFLVDENNKKNMEKGFLTAIDEVFAEMNNDGNQKKAVENMELEYLLYKNENAELKWLIDVDGKRYIRGLENQDISTEQTTESDSVIEDYSTYEVTTW